MADVTVIFADLEGSTRVFESLGNAKATRSITRLIQWIGTVCASHGGRVVKSLGDGVMVVFADNLSAVQTVVELQRAHSDRIRTWPETLKMRLQVGIAHGDVVEQDGDCFGDAVNVASRLSDLCGPGQILAADAVIQQLASRGQVRSYRLGAMDIRGRSEPCVVHRIEWQNDMGTDFLTMPASLLPASALSSAVPAAIALAWSDVRAQWTFAQLPVLIGRDAEAQFVVNDPRVSRLHARIQWRSGRFYIEDMSSYGTWLRFSGSAVVTPLRRQEMLLPGDGEASLGTPFEDARPPTVRFQLVGVQAAAA